MTTDDRMLLRIYEAGGTWSDVIAHFPEGVELMQKGLIELVKPDAPYLPFARLTTSGLRKAESLAA